MIQILIVLHVKILKCFYYFHIFIEQSLASTAVFDFQYVSDNFDSYSDSSYADYCNHYFEFGRTR